MRHVGYRWEEIIDRLDGSSRLNIHWQRSFFEYSLNGWSMESSPSGREVLVFEGDAELIRAIQEAAETVTKSVHTDAEQKA